jgi:hypothetical protein
MAGLIRGNLHPAGAEYQRFVFELRTDPLRSEEGGFSLPLRNEGGSKGMAFRSRTSPRRFAATALRHAERVHAFRTLCG